MTSDGEQWGLCLGGPRDGQGYGGLTPQTEVAALPRNALFAAGDFRYRFTRVALGEDVFGFWIPDDVPPQIEAAWVMKRLVLGYSPRLFLDSAPAGAEEA